MVRRTRVVERMGVELESLYYQEHVARYIFALQSITNGPVLDIATGNGYGSDLIVHACGDLVVGVDIDRPVLNQDRARYPDPALAFLAASGTALPFTEHSFQAVVSLETIEHVADDRGFLHELARVLRPDGICIISTPNHSYSMHHEIVNPYHVREYEEGELRALLEEYFETVDLFYQGFGQDYYSEVATYQTTIQERKEQLPAPLRLVIDRVYRPIKQRIPDDVTNFFIRRWLRLSYPQPSEAAITIADHVVEDTSVFVACCCYPRVALASIARGA